MKVTGTRDPLSEVSTLVTPQSQPIPGRNDMKQNEAGGYVFEKDPMQRLEDFLILGTTGGTYYAGQDKLTLSNANLVFDQVNGHGVDVISKLAAISTSSPPRAPSNRGCMFALAAVSTLGDLAGRQAVKSVLPGTARTTDHLSQFFGYHKQLKTGKSGRSFRSAMAAWFTEADAQDKAFTACKARQRKTPAGEAFDLRDALRLGHPSGLSPDQEMLFKWLAGKATDSQAAEQLRAVSSWQRAQAVKTPTQAINLIDELRIPWEFLPSEVLSSPGVWEALAETSGLTAVLRNLARMTRIGTLRPLSPALATVTRRLTDPGAIAKARVHPLSIYLALRVYASGYSQPNSKASVQTWDPVSGVLDVLEEAYELSFGYIQPSGKKVLIAVDSSGSMDFGQVTMNGSNLGRSYDVANAMALTLLRIERSNAHVIDVDMAARASRLTARSRLAEPMSWRPSGGGTDMSQPFKYALDEKLRVDGVVVFTDNQSWHGDSHSLQRLAEYRRAYGQHVRCAVATMAPNGWSILDPKDPGVLSVVGVDASLPQAVTGFIRNGG